MKVGMMDVGNDYVSKALSDVDVFPTNDQHGIRKSLRARHRGQATALR